MLMFAILGGAVGHVAQLLLLFLTCLLSNNPPSDLQSGSLRVSAYGKIFFVSHLTRVTLPPLPLT